MLMKTAGLLISSVLLFHMGYAADQCRSFADSDVTQVNANAFSHNACFLACVAYTNCYFYQWNSGCTLSVLSTPIDTSINQITSATTVCSTDPARCSAYTGITINDPIAITLAECSRRSITLTDAIGYNYVEGLCYLQFANGIKVNTNSPPEQSAQILCARSSDETTTQPPSTVTTTQPPTTVTTTQPPTTVTTTQPPTTVRTTQPTTNVTTTQPPTTVTTTQPPTTVTTTQPPTTVTTTQPPTTVTTTQPPTTVTTTQPPTSVRTTQPTTTVTTTQPSTTVTTTQPPTTANSPPAPTTATTIQRSTTTVKAASNTNKKRKNCKKGSGTKFLRGILSFNGHRRVRHP